MPALSLSLRKSEVMSPAGYWPQLRAAVEAGADSVYFGLRHFTARAKVGFGLDEVPGPRLGRDLTAPGTRLVALRDGSVTDGVLTVIGRRAGAARSCWSQSGEPVSCELAAGLIAAAREQVADADVIVHGNQAATLAGRLATAAPAARSAAPLPLVIAHRGYASEYPENTLPAIAASMVAEASARASARSTVVRSRLFPPMTPH